MIEAYAATNKSKSVLSKSSSGGVFFVLSKWIIKHDGVVYGVVIDGDGDVYHKRIHTLDEIDPVLSSKYVQSDVNNTFLECYKDLQNDKYVLYSGTPCQIYSLKQYLKIHKCNIDKLITVDFICHGTPSKNYWLEYLNYLERNNVIHKPYKVNFRHKKPSWEVFSLTINDFAEDINSSKYMRMFLENYSLTNQCYSCKFKGIKNRFSDLTMGDFWGCQKFYKQYYCSKGTSLIVINSKNKLIYSIISKELYMHEVNIIIATQFNSAFWKSVHKPKNYDILLNNFSYDNYNVASSKKIFTNRIKNFVFNNVSKIVYRYYPERIKKKPINNRVGVITLSDYVNFGNRLQNYALLKVLENNGFDAYNIVLSKYSFLSKPFLKLLSLFVRNKVTTYADDRSLQIKKACDNYEKRCRFYYTHNSKKHISKYSTIIYGSDQIWHHGCDDLLFRFGYLGLTKECEPRKISYAAGFAPSIIDEYGEYVFKSFLKTFKAVSVREKDSSSYLNSFNIDNKIVLDPTLLLTKEEWDNAIQLYSTITIPSSKYVIVYLLGGNDVSNNSYSACYSSEMINVLDPNSQYYSINQFDFLKLIKNAELIITDSYHALIFSLLFSKKYVLMERPDSNGMENRFETLNDLIVNNVFDYGVLEKRKQYSIDFLLGEIRHE